jgi:predicted  nucleic acid-binding Zn-ribbon protein
MQKAAKKIPKEISVKKLLELQGKDMKRYVGSLSEEFQGRVSAIAEQFGGLNKKLDTHEVAFSMINKKLDTHEVAFSMINKKLDTHTEMIGGMKEDIEVIKANIEIIKADVRKRVTYEEFESLTKRVNLLEKKAHR